MCKLNKALRSGFSAYALIFIVIIPITAFAQNGIIGDFVWHDTNENGIWDHSLGEIGLSGVTVNLYLSDHTPIGSTTTNGAGLYYFTNLSADDYYLEFKKSGYRYSPKDVGGDENFDSDADPVTGKTDNITLGSNENEPFWDAGMYLDTRPSAVWGDFVWNDLNKNGIQDPGEPGVGGIKVELWLEAGTNSYVYDTQYTDGSGYYNFTIRDRSWYHVKFFLPTNYAFSPKDQGADDTKDSDADQTYGITDGIEFDPSDGVEDLSWDAGIYELTPPEDCCDGNKPQILIMQYTGEDCSATNHGQDPTKVGCDGDPNYDPNVYIIANDNDSHTSGNIWFSGNVALNSTYYIDAGNVGADKLENNTVIHIFDQQGGTLLQKVNFHTSCSQPLHEHSDQWGANKLLGIIFDDGTNCGDLPDMASLGDFVWNDLDRDGIQESGELGISNVTVKLFTGSGSQVGTTTTNSSGYYLFDNLFPGDYYVEFVTPTDYYLSPQDQGGDDLKDSDANPSNGKTITTTLIANEDDMSWDAGMYYEGPEIDCCDQGDKPKILIMQYTGEDCSATNHDQDPGKAGCSGDPAFDPNVYIIANDNDDHTSGNIWFSGNVALNGTYYIDSGNAGETQLTNNTVIHIFDQQGGTLLQKVNFHTSCSQPLRENNDQWGANKLLGIIFVNGIDCGSIPASIGDFVWYDENNNGIQDAGETGLPDVTVKLFDGSGVLVDTKTTNSSGYYLFDNLTPGDYFLEFTLLPGYTFSPKDQGTDDTKDSDANSQTEVTTLSPGENDLTWDAGMYTPPAPASLGDYVWLDTDEDGVQDSGETGIPDVTVKLYTGTGVHVDTKQTNASGYYLFDNLTPGDYFVEFTLLSGYTFSPKDQGGDDTKDSDANTSSGRTVNTTLTAGENDLTWDAGMYEGTPALASIGDFVWFDTDEDGIQDSGEPGIPNVTVNLYTGTGDFVDTQQTSASGNYLFDNLTLGSYLVEFVLPNGFVFSPKDQGTDDAKDSDANTSTGQTIVTNLTAGENDLTWDAGMYIPSSDCTPPTSLCTLPNSWDYNIQITGEVQWSSLGVGNANDIKKKIRLYGDGTVIVPSGDLKLMDSGAVLFVDGPTLIVEDGKVVLDKAGSNFTMQDGALMTKDHFEQKENSIVCISGSDVEIGEEMAGTDFRSGDSSEGDFKNDGGYRYLEDNCINVTRNYLLTDKGTGTGINGVDVLLNNCIEVGDEGENHALNTSIGTSDGKDGGKWESKSRQYIFGTTIAVAKGNFTIDKHIVTVVNAKIKVNDDGDFEVKGDGIVDCGPVCVAVEDEFKNGGTWLATGVTWFSKNRSTTNVPGAGSEESEANILNACFTDCDCFPGDDCYEGTIGDYVWFDENYNGLQDDYYPSDPSHGLGDVKLTLYNGVGTPLKTTWTNDAGWYIFTNLAAGNYIVEVDAATLPDELVPLSTGVFQTYDYDGLATPNRAAVTLDFDCNNLIDCCIDGKPQTITMRYTGEDCSASSHTQDPGKATCTGNPAYDPEVYIIASDNSDFASGKIWFFGTVPINGEYTLDAALAGETRLSTNTWIHIFDQINGTLLQTVQFHTSCSQDLNAGDQFGANKLLNVVTDTGYECESNNENLDVDFGYSDIPLPVTLSSFTVTPTANNVHIHWVTESEIENQGFLIERREFDTDTDWQEIASYLTDNELEGQGSVTHRTEYEFVDKLVQTGMTYEYRLGDVDYSGVVTYHSTRSATVGQNNSNAIPNEFKVKPAYPNPFNPSTVIEYAIPTESRVNVTIYDIMGQKIASIINENQIAGWHSVQWYGQDSRGNLMPAGIYLISVNAGNSIKTMKLIFVK